MAIFIPNYIASNNKGEQIVFNRLRELPDEYCVMHSLDISNHINKICGEADFVIISKRGILCLEVKSGNISFQNGLWRIGSNNNYYEKRESPFKQSKNNMFSIKRYIQDKFQIYPNITNMIYSYAVVFPSIEKFEIDSPEIELETCIDGNKLKEKSIKEIVEGIYDFHLRKFAAIYPHVHKNILTDNEYELLKKYLRGDFQYVEALSTKYGDIEKRLLKLTEKQYEILSGLNSNERVLLQGSGGTGKTLLLYEQAKRCAIEGKKVLFLCFNKNLASYLELNLNREQEYIRKQITITRYYKYLSKNMYYENINDINELNTRFLLTHTQETYDTVIIDEGQDLIQRTTIDVIDRILKNGYNHGNWYIALDIQQNIFRNSIMEESSLKQAIDVLKHDAAVYSLNKNCRNTKQISMFNKTITGINQSINEEIDGEVVEYEVYETTEEQITILKKVISNILKDGINPKDIVILSKYDNYDYLKTRLKEICLLKKIGEANQDNDNNLFFSTIQGFKGLESNIIILLNVESFDSSDKKEKQYNYIAMSRAKVKLYILCEAHLEEYLNRNTNICKRINFNGTNKKMIRGIQEGDIITFKYDDEILVRRIVKEVRQSQYDYVEQRYYDVIISEQYENDDIENLRSTLDLAKALIGKRKGDKFIFKNQKEETEIEIIDINYFGNQEEAIDVSEVV